MTSLPSVPVLARDEAAVPSHRPPHPLDIHQRLLEAYGPPSIVINEDHDILHMSENAGKYLHFPSGEASTNLLTLIRPELRVELRAAVYQALQQRTNVEASGLPLSGDGARVNLRVRPALANEPGHGLLLVLFEEADQADGHTPAGEAIRPVGPAVRQMEEELTNVRAKLRAATQQYESQYDEFKAANEELQAMNEELRSAGEELETSKEELQSVNEELTTVNQELKVKVEELGHANDDFRNLMNSTDIATIFLDRALRVKQFTPKATEIFSLLPSDLGRPLLDLKHRLKHDGLLGDMEDVLTRLQIVEREVEAQDGTWFAVRVFPYRTSDDRLDGVVLTFVDITLRRDMIRSLQAAQEQLRLAQQASQSALWERDLVTGAERWSPEMYQIRAVDPPESPDLSVDHAAGIHHDDRARVKSALDDTVRQHRVEWDIEFRVADGEQKENSAAIRWIAERGRVRYDNGDAVRVLGVDFDVTHRKAADAAQARLASIVALSRDAVVSFDFERRVVTWNHGAETIFGLTAAEALGRDLSSIVLPEAGRQDDTIFQDVEAGRPVQDFVTRARTKSGGEIDVSVSASPVVDQAGDVIGGSLIVRDVSMQAEAERGMRQHAADLEQRVAERTQQLIDTQEEERRRIARDLHDHLGQQLTALRLSLAVCKEHAAGDETLRKQLTQAESAATQLDADVEFLAWELRPSQLDQGLVTAVDRYTREWSSHFRVAVDIHTSRIDEECLPPQAALNVYRIAQEALNNVAKHARATRVAVILEQRDQRAVLVIEDNGRGFDLPRANTESREQQLGLGGMHERAALVSGTTDIESAPGRGTTVIVQIPLRAS